MLRILLALLLFAPLAHAQPAPCPSAEATHLDFWLGTWDLTWTADDGSDGHGVNTITRTLGDCVIREVFAGDDGFAGESVSVYNPRTEQWRQTWVDNQGGYLLFTGSPDADGTMELRTAPFTNPQGNEQVNRMIWLNVTDDSFDWHWQNSTDDGQTWNDLWVIRYARR